MASAVEELTQTHAASITRASTLLIDDDANNVRREACSRMYRSCPRGTTDCVSCTTVMVYSAPWVQGGFRFCSP